MPSARNVELPVHDRLVAPNFAQQYDHQWYAFYPAHWLRRQPKRLKLHGHWLVLWRDDSGQAVAMADRCPHLGASLAGGRVRGARLECPYHGFLFDTAGVCQEIPRRARKPIPKTLCTPRFAVRELDGWIFIFWGPPGDELPEINYFPDMRERGPRSSHWYSQRLWPIHISRTIENMLDVAHLGTVHRGWLSFALGDTVEPQYEVTGQQLKLRGDRENSSYVAYAHPNLWMQWLGAKFLTCAAMVPEDDDHTRVYLRSSQGFVTLPGVGQLLAGAKHLLDTFALWQDSQVVFTQTPNTADDHRLDALVEFDIHIGELRKLRKRWHRARCGPHASDDV